jgi:hypothetical protein
MSKYQSPALRSVLEDENFLRDLVETASLDGKLLDEILSAFRDSKVDEAAAGYFGKDDAQRIAADFDITTRSIFRAVSILSYLASTIARKGASEEQLQHDLGLALKERLPGAQGFLQRLPQLSQIVPLVSAALRRREALQSGVGMLEAVGFSCDLRGVLVSAPPERTDEIDSYSPVFSELIPVVTLKLESDEEETFIVQVTAAKLRDAIQTLTMAQKQLETLAKAVSLTQETGQ